MNGLYLVIISALVFVLAYRFYGAFIAAKVLTLNQYKVTPAFRFEDGHDYVPTNKYVVFGHHFAAIAGAGPLVGPVIAAQFGYLPGALWILIGGVLAGAVHDMVILFCSMRYDGKSIAEIAKAQIGDKTGLATSFAVLFLNILAMAGMAVVIVNALHDYLNGVAFLQHVFDGVDALVVGEVANLADMQQTVGARGQVHELSLIHI